jgi:glutathione S-transferase
MKLFYSPGACSLSPHIVARELGLPVDLARVDLKAKRVDSGGDYLEINPKGYVPALQLDGGEVLTEGPAIVQYLADLAPASGLAAANGTLERYREQEMLGYINSEIHKGFSPLFNASTPEETKAERREYVRNRYRPIDARLEGRDYLFGSRFSVADAYLFTVTNWARGVHVDLSEFPNLLAFQKRVRARPAVQQAMREEGLQA